MINTYAESIKEKKSSPGKRTVLKSFENELFTAQKHGNTGNKTDILGNGNKKSSGGGAVAQPIRAPLFPSQPQYRLPLSMTLSPQPADLIGNPPLSAALVSTYVYMYMRVCMYVCVRACERVFVYVCVSVSVYMLICLKKI